MPLRSVRSLALVMTFALLAPASLGAQTVTGGVYVPPKLVKRGTATTPLSGPATIVVKVFVKKDGTSTVSGVIKSSNKEDEPAALEVAKTSTYQPATKAGQKVDAFYDYTIVFSIEGETGGPKTGLPAYEQMIHAGNYAGAKAGLATYLQAHPDDARANSDLGQANTYTQDFPAAVAAFDKAGAGIPDNAKPVAADAYSGYAVTQLNAKDLTGALASAKRAVDLAPNFATYNALGVVQFSSGDSADAIVAFQKAISLDQGVKQSDRDAANVNLAMAYADAGKFDEAKQAAAQVSAPTAQQKENIQNALSSYYIKQGQAAEKAGKYDNAVTLYQQGAAAAPGEAATFYVLAASAYLSTIKDAGSSDTQEANNQKAKAMADKALAIDPNNAQANYDAGIASAGLGQKAQALMYLNKAASAAAGSTDAGLKSAIQKALQEANDMR